MYASLWNVNQTKILTRKELQAVLGDLTLRAERSLNARLSLMVVRLACCCGLRVSEIAALRLDDVRIEGGRPHIRIRPGVAKGGRARTVPLWWDRGTLADLAAWKETRQQQGAEGEAQLVASVLSNRVGQPLSRHALRLRFQRACRVLGAERVRRLTIHHGRHTFVSHALAGGRTLAEVRDAAGHTNVGTTSVYLHIAVDADAAIGDLFQLPSH